MSKGVKFNKKNIEKTYSLKKIYRDESNYFPEEVELISDLILIIGLHDEKLMND